MPDGFQACLCGSQHLLDLRQVEGKCAVDPLKEVLLADKVGFLCHVPLLMAAAQLKELKVRQINASLWLHEERRALHNKMAHFLKTLGGLTAHLQDRK